MMSWSLRRELNPCTQLRRPQPGSAWSKAWRRRRVSNPRTRVCNPWCPAGTPRHFCCYVLSGMGGKDENKAILGLALGLAFVVWFAYTHC